MKYLLILIGSLITNFSCAQIIISQYYEGTSNDKYLEITNLGFSDYDLAANGIRAYLFANERADSPATNTASTGQSLTGLIPALGSVVFKNGLAANPGYAATSAAGANFCGFNGDDVVLLSTATDGLSVEGSAWENRIDVIGNGSLWGADLSFYRKVAVVEPNRDFSLSEWESASISLVNDAAADESVYLGHHLSVLPVALHQFSAQQTGNQVLLTFSTAGEQNNAYFQIQRSKDGRDFETIGQLAGGANNNEQINYEFVDTKPNAGLNYYRLQQFDFDGTSAIFGPVALRFEEALGAGPVIWPVPARDYLEVALPESDDSWELEVYKLNGERVLLAPALEKEERFALELSALPEGSYLLRWKNGSRSGIKRFLKL